ncbi:MAG TPA: glycosyltransferase family 9 protein, partial [Desulfobacterales bacterium]|nr:glycosyltransferase family 9 protein [Desulfobacterales bacterium]
MPQLKETLEGIETDLENEAKIKNRNIRDFIFAAKMGAHTHIHYSNKNEAIKISAAILKDLGIENSAPVIKQINNPVPPEITRPTDNKNRKIVFSHGRALGDGLMFTAGIRDFKLLFPEIQINVDTNQKELFENNPYLNTSLKKGDPDVEYYCVGYPAVGNANNTALHFSMMFLMDMIAIVDLHSPLPIKLGEFTAAFSNGSVGDPSLGKPEKNPEAKEPFISLRNKYKNFCQEFVRQRGDIHMTEEEKAVDIIKDTYGFEKYWVIAPGGKRDCTAKIWDWRQFQEVIDYFEGRIKFVVIGRSDHLIEKSLKNVIDLTDKTPNVRSLISLVYNAEGCISGPSFLMHLAAAVPPKYNKQRKPCVSIFGGREPSAWSWYCNHQMLHTNGAFTCCDNGGCWKARTHPMQKDPKHNKSLCKQTVQIDGRTIQACMEAISPVDVIMAIERYYKGDILKLEKPYLGSTTHSAPVTNYSTKSNGKQINLLGNLNSKGGGEQSLVTIAKILRNDGWHVNLYPWGSVNDKFKNEDVMPFSFQNGMPDNMVEGLPLLFYGNDSVWDFVKKGQQIVNKSSGVMIGINYVNGSLPKSQWLAASKKVKAFVFQNTEKRDEFVRDEIGFENAEKIVMFGAVDIDRFYEVCPPQRKKKEPLVVLKHCVADHRKYVTETSKNNGEKPHVWQKKFFKDTDIKLYGRLLKDMKNDVQFEFMEAHKEVVNAFKGEPRMVFHKWDAMPVEDFLARGHVYLYRTSNAWRDQYPRTVAEALLAGLPVLTEPRDGTKDRVVYGDTGFYCIDYDDYLYYLKKLHRKEDARHAMGMYAKDW